MPMASVSSGALHYDIYGSGVPVVLIHPPVLSSRSFHSQAVQLAKACQVVTFDIRGHGKSFPSEQPVTYPLVAEDIVSLMDHLGLKKAYFCGYSCGGSIMLEFLLTYPDRASGAILVSGLSAATDAGLRRKIALARLLVSKGGFYPLAMAVSWSNAISWSMFMDTLRDASQGEPRNMAEYYDYSLHYDCTARLHEIRHPVLLVYGEQDKAFHAYARLLHKNLRNSELTFIPGVTHQVPTKAALQLNDCLSEFIHKIEGKQHSV